jgi:hypothetical protein
MIGRKQVTHTCPDCGAPIQWRVSSDGGEAYCSNSPEATRIWKRGEEHLMKVCRWRGYCERRLDGSIQIYYYPRLMIA